MDENDYWDEETYNNSPYEFYGMNRSRVLGAVMETMSDREYVSVEKLARAVGNRLGRQESEMTSVEMVGPVYHCNPCQSVFFRVLEDLCRIGFVNGSVCGGFKLTEVGSRYREANITYTYTTLEAASHRIEVMDPMRSLIPELFADWVRTLSPVF